MKKVCLVGLMAVAVTMTTAMAGEKAGEAPKHEKKAAVEKNTDDKEMTITGTVQKIEKKKKDGSVMMAWFVLVDENGKEIHLPKDKAVEFDGSKVKVTGMGHTSGKDGKGKTILTAVTAIEKLDGAPASEETAK